MRVLVLFCHPVPTSFNAAVLQAARTGLEAAGHEVTVCDLYAEGFSPVLTQAERLGYHELTTNREPVAHYVDQILSHEALVIVTPIWNFGFPAMLKGFFDRVFLPGVSFQLVNGKVRPALQHIKTLIVCATYGGTRWRTFLLGDPPRRVFEGWLRVLVHPLAKRRYLALYDLNRASAAQRQAHLDRVTATLRGV